MSQTQTLREHEYDARQLARELRRLVFQDGRNDRLKDLVAAEAALQAASAARALEEAKGGEGAIVAVRPEGNLLGPATTKLEVAVDLRMATVPSSLVHLFDAQEQPLVAYRVVNQNTGIKRLRFVSYVEGYSARAVDTLEVEPLVPVTVRQLPTFFPDRLATVTELTRASLNVEVQDLDARTEVHKTVPVWLTARTTAPLQTKDPSTGAWRDMTHYLGAFVTPNAPDVMKFLAVATLKHPNQRLTGYQGDEAEVTSQVKAVFEALATSGIKYVNSVIDFTPETATATQRVRLPRESLATTSANCIDGTVLMASLLEAVSLNPAIVIIPGHAFLGWETWRNNGNWRYLETTMIATNPFDEATARAEDTVKAWQDQAGAFKRWSLRELRARGVTPLE